MCKRDFLRSNILLLAVILLVAGCSGARDRRLTGAEQNGRLEHAGLQRSYFVHVPPGYAPGIPSPLVLALHGGGGRARNMAQLSNFNRESDRAGFLVVYPEAIDQHWNDGRGFNEYRSHRDDIDDVGFLAQLVMHLASRYSLDRTRVYVTGASNGGLMSNRLGCERAELFAAIAPVIGSMAAPIAAQCRPSRPLPVLIINGTDDQLVPWSGGAVRFGKREMGKIISIPALTRFWVGHNDCNPQPQVTMLPDADPKDGTRVQRHQYAGCRESTSVVLYEVQGGGHTWPKGKKYLPELLIGRTSQDVDASRVISDFFAAHQRLPAVKATLSP